MRVSIQTTMTSQRQEIETHYDNRQQIEKPNKKLRKMLSSSPKKNNSKDQNLLDTYGMLHSRAF